MKHVSGKLVINIISELEGMGAAVSYYDPHVPDFFEEGRERIGIDNLDGLADFDETLIITNHTCFDYDDICNRSKLVVDTRNATKAVRATYADKIRLL